jgi:MFS family permease
LLASDETTPRIGASSPGRLWGRNFLLLWQGQLVSGLGDVVYEIALGFWILAVTGSTALMGSLMAASALPRILVAPIAGVVVDRSERKWLLISMDLARGVCVVLVAAAAFAGVALWTDHGVSHRRAVRRNSPSARPSPSRPDAASPSSWVAAS